jgi:hypothetical protein
VATPTQDVDGGWNSNRIALSRLSARFVNPVTTLVFVMYQL